MLFVDISAAVISAWKKDDMRATLKKVKKIVDDADKALRASYMQNAVEKAKSLIQQKPDMVTCIDLFEAGSNTKILDAALKQFKNLSPKTAAMLFSVDCDNKKAICMSVVPKDVIEKGLKADEWTKAVSEILGGKSGGKEMSAQASGPNVNDVQKAMEVAQQFANSKLQN